MYHKDKNKYLAEVAARRFQEELDGKRKDNGVSELFGKAGNEQYEVCPDAM